MHSPQLTPGCLPNRSTRPRAAQIVRHRLRKKRQPALWEIVPLASQAATISHLHRPLATEVRHRKRAVHRTAPIRRPAKPRREASTAAARRPGAAAGQRASCAAIAATRSPSKRRPARRRSGPRCAAPAPNLQTRFLRDLLSSARLNRPQCRQSRAPSTRSSSPPALRYPDAPVPPSPPPRC